MKQDLKDKVVLVTGASHGIGLATGRALADQGAHVIFAARRKHLLDKVVAEVRGQGKSALALALDVTSDASVNECMALALAAWGRIDVAINNAGSGGQLAHWLDSGSETFRAQFDVHVFGAERVMRAVATPMRQAGGGTIVNVVSAVAWVAMPGASAYCAAKSAVVTMSESLRAELAGSRIDVRLFAPPFTRTDPDLQWPLDTTRIFEREWVAAELVRCLRGGRSRVLAGGNERLLWLNRVSPALATHIVHGIGLRALAKGNAACRGAGRDPGDEASSRLPR